MERMLDSQKHHDEDHHRPLKIQHRGSPKHSKLNFDNSSISSAGSGQVQLYANPVVLQYDPLKQFKRSTREIKHSHDRFVVDTDYPDKSSTSGISLDRSFATTTSNLKRGPEYASMYSTTSSAYLKGKSSGRMRKVTLAKLEHLTRSSELPGGGSSLDGIQSEAFSLSSLQSKSVDDLFSSVFMSREETKKELTDELCFTSKVATPRLLKTDPEARFASKDILNGLIEDVSLMSVSSLGTKGQSMDGAGSIGTMREFRSLYEKEKATYDSAALYAEIRYMEMKAQERSQGSHPSKLKATVCADLLLKLCSATGRYSKVMMPILWELLNCVFIGFPALEDKLKTEDGALKALYGMNTYFDKHREQLEIYDDIHNELEMVQQGKKMGEIVKRFQTIKMVFHAGNFYHRDVSFFLWKGELFRAKQRRNVAQRRSLLYRWRTWRAYLKRYKVDELEDMDVELDKKLESLSRLQLLLQSHGTPQPSPKHTDSMLMQTGRSSKLNLARVNEVEDSTVTGVDGGDRPGSGTMSPKTYDSPKGTLNLGSVPPAPSMSPFPLSRGSSGKFMRERSGVLPVTMRAPLTPSASMTTREMKQYQQSKLSARKELLNQVDSSIRNTLSAFTMPVAEGGIVPDSAVGSMAEGEGEGAGISVGVGRRSDSQLSSASRSLASGSVTVDQLKEAALIASAAVCPRKEQTTQTPDVWMTNVNEQPFTAPMVRGGSQRFALARQPSGVGRKSPEGGSPAQLRGKSMLKEEGRVDVGGFQPPPFKLEIAAACQLITYIYSAKLRDGLHDHDEINFLECLPLLEYSKEIMLKRYGLRRLADKFYKGLLACVMKEGILNRRLEMFANICGITLEGHKEGHGAYTEIQCSYYFRALGIIFGENLYLLEESMNSFEIDREIILEVLLDLFPAIEKRNAELAKTIMFEVVDLPRNTPGNDLEYKVNFDDLMALLMDYFNDEHKYDPEDPFLYEPLIHAPEQPMMDTGLSVTVTKPKSPEQLQALVALGDFSKPKPVIAETPKKTRIVRSAQHLV